MIWFEGLKINILNVLYMYIQSLFSAINLEARAPSRAGPVLCDKTLLPPATVLKWRTCHLLANNRLVLVML